MNYELPIETSRAFPESTCATRSIRKADGALQLAGHMTLSENGGRRSITGHMKASDENVTRSECDFAVRESRRLDLEQQAISCQKSRRERSCQRHISRCEDIVPLEKSLPKAPGQTYLLQPNGIADEDVAVGKYVLDQAKRKKIRLREITEI